MRLLHISDLHIGKRVNDFSMIEDQTYILNQIIKIIEDKKPDAILIAGDVYDKSLPSAEGVTLLDKFLVDLSKCKTPVFLTSGNHDSAERLAFGGRLIDVTGIHISPIYDGTVKSFTLEDENGKVNFYLLPFIKPVLVKRYFETENIQSYTDAMNVVIRSLNINKDERNVLIAHQFVTGGERSDSEDMSVGGMDNIDASCFKDFDYVALGHLHKPQCVGSDNIRYSGSPLKYSFSEAKDEKSVCLVDIPKKGQFSYELIPLKPLHDLVDLRGIYDELRKESFYKGTSYQSDYVRITLTDEDDVVNALSNLRNIYNNLMELRYDNKRTRAQEHVEVDEEIVKKTPIEIFNELYKVQNGSEITDEQRKFLEELIAKVWEDNE